jgi:hypothetical protein
MGVERRFDEGVLLCNEQDWRYNRVELPHVCMSLSSPCKQLKREENTLCDEQWRQI